MALNLINESELAGNPIIEKSLAYIHAHYAEEVSLDAVAKHVSLSRVYFCSFFKRTTGQNFFQVLNLYRLEVAKELLSRDNIRIPSVAEKVGYKSLPYFYKIFRRHTGLTPAEYRQQRLK